MIGAAPPPPDYVAFERELTALGERLRRDIGKADFRHLLRIQWIGRLCMATGLATAWIAPNPLSVVLLAQGMIVRFFIGHHVGHGGYDAVPGIPARYTRKHFARGWRRFLDWPDWWNHEAWLYTHNQLHHPLTQSPLDADVMDSVFLLGTPKWLRVLYFGFATATWKFLNYAPRMQREQALGATGAVRTAPYEMRPGDLADIGDPLVRKLWIRDYAPYMAFRFALPAVVVAPLGAWAMASMAINLILAELLHNAQTFICIRPSHCAADIPLFGTPFADRKEFYLQSVLGTVNYRAGGDLNDILHGWTNYQVEHHIWPTLTLLQYRKARPGVVDICRRNGVPYREGSVFARYVMTGRLFMGLEHQTALDTKAMV